MPLNFPANPSDGDTYEGYVYDAIAGVWNGIPSTIESAGGGFVASATAPENPSEGDGWFDTNTAKSYIFYDGFWVQIGANGTLNLSDIGGVSIASPASGESLVYDGTEWVNQNVDVYDVGTNSTGKFALPSGTTAERPATPDAGDIRFNTETGRPEWYSADFSDWYDFHEFPSTTFNVEYLVIAGGGGGGSVTTGNTDVGEGGGGAGGYRSSVLGESSGGGSSTESIITVSSGIAYPLEVGAGGAGGASGTPSGQAGSNGGSSQLSSNIISIGGGGGGRYQIAGSTGGSGGGGGRDNAAGAVGTNGQGYQGGNGGVNCGGGGGGAGSAGSNSPSTTVGGEGGNGVASSITGLSVTRAGGGGGGSGATPGSGGTGGGGQGGGPGTDSGSPGTTNTGSGGGGAGADASTSAGGNGGSGIVIIKYPSSQSVSPSLGLSYTTTDLGTHKVTEFTAGAGTVTFS